MKCTPTSELPACLVAAQCDGHLARSKNGVTEEELVEALTHLAFYVGWPNAMSAVNRAKALFTRKEG